jgi:hypothetical protein
MGNQDHNFAVGDRVRARRRPDFPDGTILQVLSDSYLLVQWNGTLLETVHHDDIVHIES